MKAKVSIIIPVYNVESYLEECLDSIINQNFKEMEIILVNDGSTDNSGIIAEEYSKRDGRIRIIHQENGGASAARNIGLDLAQGEYIAFIDSDDWVKENSLCILYNEAIRHQADVVMGKTLVYHKSRKIGIPYRSIPDEIKHTLLSGKECFILLQKAKVFVPMVFNYIYRKSFLDRIKVRFEEGIMTEDELWTPIVICQAEKMVVIDIDFYYYRLQECSVMYSTNIRHRLNSLFKVTEKLFEFAVRFDFSGEDAELKNWLYVNIFKLYSIAFEYVSNIKDSSIILPYHHLDCFSADFFKMLPEPQKMCLVFFQKSQRGLKKYNDWLSSYWVASIPSQIASGKKLMLIYNTKFNRDLDLNIEDVPADWVIATDRRYFHQANVVVFYLPTLSQELECDLDKPQEQIWVAWYLEPYTITSEMKELFDIFMSFDQKIDEQKEHPLVRLCRKLDEINIEF